MQNGLCRPRYWIYQIASQFIPFTFGNWSLLNWFLVWCTEYCSFTEPDRYWLLSHWNWLIYWIWSSDFDYLSWLVSDFFLWLQGDWKHSSKLSSQQKIAKNILSLDWLLQWRPNSSKTSSNEISWFVLRNICNVLTYWTIRSHCIVCFTSLKIVFDDRLD